MRRLIFINIVWLKISVSLTHTAFWIVGAALFMSIVSIPKSIQIVYFPVRARAETARMILEYGNIKYVDKSVAQYFGAGWKDAKPKAPFGQLPLLDVDGEAIAQSGAIVRYSSLLDPAW